MANTYFQFKQFTINQDQCAMKVSTEACIFGAWVPDLKSKKILDIGTGTGLLSLMLAQRFSCDIDAVELDSNAASQAIQNVGASPWQGRINVNHENIFEWAKKTEEAYDCIVCNPPFFTNSQKSLSENKNLAKHDGAEFNKRNLALTLKKLLDSKGVAFIIYPEIESNQFKQEIENIDLFFQSALIIRNQPKGPVFRVVSAISVQPIDLKQETLNIRSGGAYTTAYLDLLKPYYLKL